MFRRVTSATAWGQRPSSPVLCCRWKLIKLGHWARAGERVRLQYNVRWAAPEVVAADLDGVRAICLQVLPAAVQRGLLLGSWAGRAS